MRSRTISVAATALFVLAVSACSGEPSPQATAQKKDPERVAGKEFDSGNFSDRSIKIDNQWLPLIPGTQLVFEGQANRGAGQAPHRVVFTVTDLTKVIDGVRNVVLWDQDFSEGRLVEEEIAFHAQDDDGNVWLMGEHPEEYEDGKFIGAPGTWVSGIDKAQAGIIMPAEPRVGMPSYRQGFAPEVRFEDLAKVSRVGEKTCVPAGCYDNVMVIDEWDPLDQPADGHQFKYHAPGTGVVRIEAKGGEEQETLVLVEVIRLSPEALAEAREKALVLDKRAYEINKSVWATTPPAEPAPEGKPA